MTLQGFSSSLLDKLEYRIYKAIYNVTKKCDMKVMLKYKVVRISYNKLLENEKY